MNGGTDVKKSEIDAHFDVVREGGIAAGQFVLAFADVSALADFVESVDEERCISIATGKTPATPFERKVVAGLLSGIRFGCDRSACIVADSPLLTHDLMMKSAAFRFCLTAFEPSEANPTTPPWKRIPEILESFDSGLSSVVNQSNDSTDEWIAAISIFAELCRNARTLTLDKFDTIDPGIIFWLSVFLRMPEDAPSNFAKTLVERFGSVCHFYLLEPESDVLKKARERFASAASQTEPLPTNDVLPEEKPEEDPFLVELRRIELLGQQLLEQRMENDVSEKEALHRYMKIWKRPRIFRDGFELFASDEAFDSFKYDEALRKSFDKFCTSIAGKPWHLIVGNDRNRVLAAIDTSATKA